MPAGGSGTFDPTIETVRQPDDFSCSICATAWCLRSIGLDVTSDDLRALMVPGLVTPADGLLDASGATIARLLRQRWGLRAQNQAVASFDEVAARAGRQPLAIGGRDWSAGVGHWVAVRRFEQGELVLANPGGTGPRFGQQRLDRAAFDQRGPFAAVWIELSESATATQVPELAFVPAGRFTVVRTDGEGIRVRDQPFQAAARRAGVVEGGTVEGAELAWRQVSDEQGNRGWIAGAYLEPDGDRFRVDHTDGVGVFMRRWPDRSAERLQGYLDGALLSGERNAFRQVRTDAGVVGWAPDAYLEPADQLGWSPAVGAGCAAENFWDPAGQPHRRAAMERFNRLPLEQRRAIFEAALDQGLSDEGVADPDERDRWKQAMRAIALGGPDFPGECPDLNPFMLAGESGGVFRGGADRLNSSALGYFQFIAQRPIPVGQPFSPEQDYGHWRRFGPFPNDYARQTDPVCQVRQFIRAIRASHKHHGDPSSVVHEKATPPHTWGP